MGIAEASAKDFDRAESLQREALGVFSASGNERLVRETLGMLGWIALARGDYEEAHALCERALRMSREAGDLRGISLSGGNLGHVLAHKGRFDEVLALLREALLLDREHSNLPYVSGGLVEIASIAIARRDYEPAAILVAASAAVSEALEYALDPVVVTMYEEILGVVRAALATDRLDLITAHGREMTLDEIVAYAVEFIDST